MLMHTEDLPVSWTMDGGSPAVRLEPLSVALLKKHLRFGSSSEDDVLAVYLSMGRQYFEEQSGRQTLDAVFEYALAGTPCERTIELPRPPLSSVVSITYDDVNGDAQTFATDQYRVLPSLLSSDAVDPYCARGRVELVSGASWPSTTGKPRSFRIRRVCGYGDTQAEMPPLVVGAIAQLAGHFFRNREAVTPGQLYPLPMGPDMMIQAFKYSALPTRCPLTSSAWRTREFSY